MVLLLAGLPAHGTHLLWPFNFIINILHNGVKAFYILFCVCLQNRNFVYNLCEMTKNTRRVALPTRKAEIHIENRKSLCYNNKDKR